DMIAEDVERLRDKGYKDRAILDINQIVAYFAYVNRIADGLGVDLEDYWYKK
ncbi:MAG: peroxidase-related enzyme, partial [bacterium]